VLDLAAIQTRWLAVCNTLESQTKALGKKSRFYAVNDTRDRFVTLTYRIDGTNPGWLDHGPREV
jgi:hypothetical protein